MSEHDGSELPVGPYVEAFPAFQPYDPIFPAIAGGLMTSIMAADHHLEVHHIGSTAIPGCGGKGYIDLMVTYPEGQLESAKETLRNLGFQRQGGRDPWPESRPMRVGCVEADGRTFRVHAHVIGRESEEVARLLAFRDRLRNEPALVRQYEADKRRVLAEGVRDGGDYADRKGDFIATVLGARGRAG